jgi:hypothetical protein
MHSGTGTIQEDVITQMSPLFFCRPALFASSADGGFGGLAKVAV